jgi:hypothetical protein
MLNRRSLDAAREDAFTEFDRFLLDELVPNRHGYIALVSATTSLS